MVGICVLTSAPWCKHLRKLWNYQDFCIDYSNVWPDVYVSPIIDCHNLA